MWKPYSTWKKEKGVQKKLKKGLSCRQQARHAQVACWGHAGHSGRSRDPVPPRTQLSAGRAPGLLSTCACRAHGCWCPRACSVLEHAELPIRTCMCSAHVGGLSHACLRTVGCASAAAHKSWHVWVSRLRVWRATHVYSTGIHTQFTFWASSWVGFVGRVFSWPWGPITFLILPLFKPRPGCIYSRFITFGLHLGRFSLITFCPRTLADMS